MATVREFLRDNISQVIEAFDEHEAHIETWRTPAIYRCACGFRGIEAEWEQHLAECMARRFDTHEELTLL